MPRPRKSGRREPNGRISRAMHSDAILPETINRRRDLAPPRVTDDELRSADFGTPIALLAAHGVITELQKEAAFKAERIYARWRFMCGAPARHASDHAGGAPQGDPDPRAWQHAKAAFEMLEASVKRSGILGASTIESIIYDAWFPAPWIEVNGRINPGYAKAQKAFRAALDAIVKDFGLEARGNEPHKPLAA